MITSINNQKIKDLAKLKQKKYREIEKCYLVEGEHLVEEAYKSGVLKEVLTSECGKYNYENMTEVSQEVIEKLAFTSSPQKIIGVCKMNESNELNKEGKKFILLDNLQDPGNIGTIVRTALAFNYDQIILSTNSVDLYNDKFIRSTQGACFHISCIKHDLVDAIQTLKKNNVTVIGTSLHEASDINDTESKEKVAIVLGNEGNGVSNTVLNETDYNVYIPIQKAESLNVAIAGAICMFYYK